MSNAKSAITPVKVTGLKLAPDEPLEKLLDAALERTGLGAAQVSSWRVLRRSLDARGRSRPSFEHTVGLIPVAGVEASGKGVVGWRDKGRVISPVPSAPESPPLVVGAGPAGLFAALRLCAYGLKPILLERGEPIEQRVRDVARYWRTGEALADSNVQFGEGGAGAFSDGKLTSRSKDFRRDWVLEQLVEAGAPESILFDAKPHLGTDRLKKIVKALRARLLKAGARIEFGERVEGLLLGEDECAAGVIAASGEQRASAVFLGVGHSARELMKSLAAQGVEVSAKGFAMGVRAEVFQDQLDSCQYGEYSGHPGLEPAEFALTGYGFDGAAKRGVYSFCMCPGGTVIPAGVEPGGLVINGMSGGARSGRFANAALVVEVAPGDFGGDPFAGYELQREVERRAFTLARARAVPAQPLASFVGRAGHGVDGVATSCPWPLADANLDDCLPPYVASALRDALPGLVRKLGPLERATLMAAETRTSSPLRVERDRGLESVSVKGLYPIGEGAGYAGGIVSSAIDGVKAVDSYAQKLGGELIEREESV